MVGGSEGEREKKCINMMKNPDKGKLDLAITSVSARGAVSREREKY